MPTACIAGGFGSSPHNVQIWFVYDQLCTLNVRMIRRNGICVPGPLWVDMYWGLLQKHWVYSPSVESFRLRVPLAVRETPPVFIVPESISSEVGEYDIFSVSPERFMEGLTQAFPLGKPLLLGADALTRSRGRFVFGYHAAPIGVC